MSQSYNYLLNIESLFLQIYFKPFIDRYNIHTDTFIHTYTKNIYKNITNVTIIQLFIELRKLIFTNCN